MKEGRVVGIYHAGITVRDLEISKRFYCDELGLNFISERDVTDDYIFNIVSVPGATSIKTAFLSVPGTDVTIELLEYSGSERYSGSSRPNDYGTGHLCLFVENLEEFHSELSSKNIQFRSESPVYVTSGINKGGKIIYCHDPDGYIVELVEPRKI